MMKLKNLYEDFDLARTALEYYGYDKEKTESILKYFRISSNAVYPFIKDNEKCYLRLGPSDEKDYNNVFAEIEFIDYLSNDFNSVKVMENINGDKCFKLSYKGKEYYVSAFTKADGIAIEEQEITNDIMFAYGKTLGELHNISRSYTPNNKRIDYHDCFSFIENSFNSYNGSENSYKELDYLKDEFEKITKTSFNYGLIHYDFEMDNVFYNPETNKCSVIDFDDSMYNFYSLDLFRVFYNLKDDLSDCYSDCKKPF